MWVHTVWKILENYWTNTRLVLDWYLLSDSDLSRDFRGDLPLCFFILPSSDSDDSCFLCRLSLWPFTFDFELVFRRVELESLVRLRLKLFTGEFATDESFGHELKFIVRVNSVIFFIFRLHFEDFFIRIQDGYFDIL